MQSLYKHKHTPHSDSMLSIYSTHRHKQTSLLLREQHIPAHSLTQLPVTQCTLYTNTHIHTQLTVSKCSGSRAHTHTHQCDLVYCLFHNTSHGSLWLNAQHFEHTHKLSQAHCDSEFNLYQHTHTHTHCSLWCNAQPKPAHSQPHTSLWVNAQHIPAHTDPHMAHCGSMYCL